MLATATSTWQQRNRNRVNAYHKEYRHTHGYGPAYEAKYNHKKIELCLQCNKPLNGEWRLHLSCIPDRVKSLTITEAK